jgi:hypothetical protein
MRRRGNSASDEALKLLGSWIGTREVAEPTDVSER